MSDKNEIFEAASKAATKYANSIMCDLPIPESGNITISEEVFRNSLYTSYYSGYLSGTMCEEIDRTKPLPF